MSFKNLLTEIFQKDLRFGKGDLQGLDLPNTFRSKDQGFYFTYNPKTFTLLIHSTDSPYHDKMIKLGQNQNISVDVGDYKGFVDINLKQVIFEKNPKRTKQKQTPNIKEFKKILLSLISTNKVVSGFSIKDFFPGWNVKVALALKKPDPYQAILQRNHKEISQLTFYYGTSMRVAKRLDVLSRGISGNNKFLHDSYLGKGLPLTLDKNKAIKRAWEVVNEDEKNFPEGYPKGERNSPVVLEIKNLDAFSLYPSSVNLPSRFKSLDVLLNGVPTRMKSLWQDVVSQQFMKMLQFADKNYPKLIRKTLEDSDWIYYFGVIPGSNIKYRQRKKK